MEIVSETPTAPHKYNEGFAIDDLFINLKDYFQDNINHSGVDFFQFLLANWLGITQLLIGILGLLAAFLTIRVTSAHTTALSNILHKETKKSRKTKGKPKR